MDGKLLASGSDADTVSLLDLESGDVSVLQHCKISTEGVLVSLDGQAMPHTPFKPRNLAALMPNSLFQFASRWLTYGTARRRVLFIPEWIMSTLPPIRVSAWDTGSAVVLVERERILIIDTSNIIA